MKLVFQIAIEECCCNGIHTLFLCLPSVLVLEPFFLLLVFIPQYDDSSVQGQAGWSCEQPGLVEDVPAHGRGIGTRWSLRSLPTQTILWPYDSGNERKRTLTPDFLRGSTYVLWLIKALRIQNIFPGGLFGCKWCPAQQSTVTPASRPVRPKYQNQHFLVFIVVIKCFLWKGSKPLESIRKQAKLKKKKKGGGNLLFTMALVQLLHAYARWMETG